MNVIIPDSVKKIKLRAFSECEKLEVIRIPNGVTEIEMGTFNRCGNLENVYIPESVVSIGMYAFDECFKLTIHSKEGSIAEEYAVSSKIAFMAD